MPILVFLIVIVSIWSLCSFICLTGGPASWHTEKVFVQAELAPVHCHDQDGRLPGAAKVWPQSIRWVDLVKQGSTWEYIRSELPEKGVRTCSVRGQPCLSYGCCLTLRRQFYTLSGSGVTLESRFNGWWKRVSWSRATGALLNIPTWGQWLDWI